MCVRGPVGQSQLKKIILVGVGVSMSSVTSPPLPSNGIQEINYLPVSANGRVFVRAFEKGNPDQ